MKVTELDFKWARHQWEDPMTGTHVVKLSPDQPLHFRNAYFRTPLFTPDGHFFREIAIKAATRIFLKCC